MATAWNDLDEYEAARWWIEEREGWPLDRALRVWLAYEAHVDWNPDDPHDATQYDVLFDDVLAAARERGLA